MSIFANNITPTLPSDLSWNKIGYIEWEKYLQEQFIDHTRNWGDISGLTPNLPSYSKNVLKRKFSNKTKLDKKNESDLNEVLERIYKKYGVWVKYKVLMGDNKRIKSIYFYKFC